MESTVRSAFCLCLLTSGFRLLLSARLPRGMSSIKQFDSVSTSFVNVGALIRYLREQSFKGSVRVALSNYEADVFLNGSREAVVIEIDPASRVTSQRDGAMERLLVHAREPDGIITVHDDAAKVKPSRGAEAESANAFQAEFAAVSVVPPDDDEIDWDDLLQASGELIQAVEHAVQSAGANFDSRFRSVAIELGDDYPFLDPTAGNLQYANGVVKLSELPSANAYVTGLGEGLRRVVNRQANGKDGKRFRERVAVELIVASRTRSNGLGEFTSHLDRIAGTRVI
jgi:hypothetical protein